MAQSDFLTYKGRPLVRSGDTIYYGSSSEKYVIMLQILSKKSEKNGLYNALDIGAIWLERSLKTQ